ncbi:MAG: hypothetical protein L6Q73_06330 [Aquabacterium sp.]|nr:hypothetical protein [Aquabacterium sp.]
MARAPVLTAIVATAAVTAGAAVFNPTPEQHRARIKQAVTERSPIAGALGVGALTAFVSSYHSIGVASYTTVDGKTVSVGAFGMVFVLESRRK